LLKIKRGIGNEEKWAEGSCFTRNALLNSKKPERRLTAELRGLCVSCKGAGIGTEGLKLKGNSRQKRIEQREDAGPEDDERKGSLHKIDSAEK